MLNRVTHRIRSGQGPFRNAPIGLLTRSGWACVGTSALLLLLPLYWEPIGWPPVLAVLALVVLSAARPADGLLLLAGIGPIAAMTFVALRSGPSPVRFEEALTLGFLAGWAISRAARTQPARLNPWLRCAVALLAATAVASGIVTAALIVPQQTDGTASGIVTRWLVRESMIGRNPLTATLLLLECLLLFVAAADVIGGDRVGRVRVLRMAVVGAAAAASFNALRLVTAALQQEDGWRAFFQYLANVRANVHFPDLNAAGSYFVMMLFIALGLGRIAPLVAWPAAVLIAIAVWISGSRIALGAMLVVGVACGLVALRVRERPGPALATAFVVVALIVGAWSQWYPEGRNLEGVHALAFRIETARAGLQLTLESPAWGVGLGRFQAASAPYLRIPENAHNQFIQMLAELGIPALALFGAILALAIREAWRTRGLHAATAGLIAGISAYLLTCLGGHPLLVHGAAYPFWIVLGLAAAQSTPTSALPRAARLAAVVFIGIVLVALPFRIAAATRNAYVEHASIGLSSWQGDENGRRFRWAEGRSAFFVSAAARAVRIPMRVGERGPDPLEVRIFLEGREANRMVLTRSAGWQTVLLLPGGRAAGAFRRVDLELWDPSRGAPLDVRPTNATGILMVGRATTD